MIAVAAAVMAGGRAGAVEPAGDAVPRRPNIIFLLTDDQRDGTFAAMGHPFVQTPHLDRLMREGVRFRNAYAASPVCAPSRVSFLTGMLERVHGVGFSSSYQLSEAQWERTYPALLRKAGYHTGFIGKFGVEYYAFKGHGDEKFDFWWAHDGWTRFFPKEHDSPSTAPYHRAKGDLITPIMGEAMTEFLDRAPADRPFCLSVSFNVPHGSQTTSMHAGYDGWQRMSRPANENPKLAGHPFYDHLYRDIEIPLPPDTATDPYRFLPAFILDQDRGRRNQTYAYSYHHDTCREHHIRYFQQITGLDHVVGELRAELDRRGLAANTVILYGSDHGLLMGEYGMGGKELLYDLSAKIPCLVHDPRLPASLRGRQLDQFVSGIDYTATILDYAGVEQPGFMDGQSLRPLVEGRDVPWREELFLEGLFTMRDTPFQEGIRTPRWKYIRMYDGVMPWRERDVDFRGRQPDFEMLFDLAADPGERTNLADAAAHRDVIESLRAKVAAESVALNARREGFKQAVATEPRQRAAPAKPRPAQDAGQPARTSPPNIVCFLFDDLGWGQPQCYDPESALRTPHLDRLAREGMRFTDAHAAAAVCTPTRYGLLTGRYPWRIGQYGVLTTFSAPIIPASRMTVASLLESRGYDTACFGKWHLGMDWPEIAKTEGDQLPLGSRCTGGPIALGFDTFCGFTHARNIGTLIEQDRVATHVADVDNQPLVLEKTLAWLAGRRASKKPFFLYVPVCPPHAPIVPAAEFRGTSGGRDVVLNNPLYADWVYQGDAMLGRIMEAIDALGLAADTLIIATSDNGAEGRPYAPWRDAKRSIHEGGHRVPFVVRWPGRVAPGSTWNHPACLNDLMATAAELTGATLPDGAGEDSVSLLPALLGRTDKPTREATVHQSARGDLAIRQGPWKLIFALDGGRTLYNLDDDPGERKPLPEDHEAVDRLTAVMKGYVQTGRSTPGEPQPAGAIPKSLRLPVGREESLPWEQSRE